ncbi:MAG TPA: hypothetical protein VGE01_12880 [Fimbriimonas sp.]
MTEDKNVYGENKPPEEGRKEHGIREEVAEKDKDKDTAADLEETRKKMSQENEGGGMGRSGTPKDSGSQGTWSRPEEE